MIQRSRSTRVAFALVCATCCFARPAAAHESSVTKVHLSISANTVRATFEPSAADVLNFVLNEPDRHAFLDDAETTAARPRVVEYVLKHVELRAGGRVLHAESAKQADAVTIEWHTPADAREATLSLDLFDAPDFAALFEITTDHDGAWEPRREYLHVNEAFAFDLPGAGRADAPARAGASVAALAQQQPRTWLETFWQFLRLGFTHIIPNGLDHILFVTGLFFLSPRLKPLLTQATAFTIAHSITLALSVLGYVSLPSRVVEPLIAISITTVALENIFVRRVRPWRWAIVFAFGLIHGLGFAGILRETTLPAGITAALVSFNVGVELGQIAVIVALFAVTYWVQKRSWYFRYVSAPASLLIAAVGLFWTAQRLFVS